jgi:hypothetical protein
LLRTQAGSCFPGGDAGGGGVVRGERGLDVASRWCGAHAGTGVRTDPKRRKAASRAGKGEVIVFSVLEIREKKRDGWGDRWVVGLLKGWTGTRFRWGVLMTRGWSWSYRSVWAQRGKHKRNQSLLGSPGDCGDGTVSGTPLGL